MNLKNRIEYSWIVTFGPKTISLRESKTFYDEQSAIEFFKEKDKTGLYVDAYKITNHITIEKLSK